jgi:hypothetical protein
MAARRELNEQTRVRDLAEGPPALLRLLEIARHDSGQCGRVAAFLAGMYNGMRCPVDLTDLRGLDLEISDDICTVMWMDR